MDMKRAVIFANGVLLRLKAVRACIREGDLIVAADGGSRHLRRLELIPDWVVGDLDSLPAELLVEYSRLGVKILSHPAAKNETDLELALQMVVRDGYRHIRIIGGLGGRLDQTLGNLSLLTSPELVECDVRLEDGREEAFLIRKNGEIDGKEGDTVSLLPFNGPAEGITTEALEYALRNETLFPDKTRGISNVMQGSKAAIRIESGLLICIHRRKRF